jgi:hypothetical protein
MKIDIKLIPLTRQKPIEVKECSIKLEHDFFEYTSIFRAKEFQLDVDDDEFEKLKEDDTQWVEAITDLKYFGYKIDVLGFERSWLEPAKVYMVSLKTRDTNVKFFFKKVSQADEMYCLLIDWKNGKLED